MNWPTNSTGLSLAGVLKWIFILMGGVLLFQAYQGIIDQKSSTGRGSSLQPLSGEAAVRAGWGYLGSALLFFAIAWALWFFWQRNED